MSGTIPMQQMAAPNGENVTFIGGHNKEDLKFSQGGCCRSKHTRNCCWVTLVLGALFILLAIIVLATGFVEHLLDKIVLSTMPLKKDSDRYNSWLNPPVQPYLTGYGFNVTNPDEVIAGMKPKLQEVGPFVYKAVTVKDSRDSIIFNEDGETLTYRPRKFYFLDREKSVNDPDKTFITVPNIPMITALSSVKNAGFLKKQTTIGVATKTGRATPFINVSFSGLLWGYQDDLPCFKIPRPTECPKPDEEAQSGLSLEDDDEEDDWLDDDEDWKRRRKRQADFQGSQSRQKRSASDDERDLEVELRDGPFEEWQNPKGGYENCSCIWGLFRDRNVTLRKPVRIYHGMSDLSMKGWVKEFDDEPILNWWKKDSKCDQLGGFDGATLPPEFESDSMDIFISLMCRKITLQFEKEEIHKNGLIAKRFIPNINAMGSHFDSNMTRRNPDNECYCREGFPCMKTGVLHMGPCKVSDALPGGAPMALSYPHFYQADESYLNAVEGLKPVKENHQFYLDLNTKLGIPLAIRPRFQLNVVINRDEDIPLMSRFQKELVLPFLWAQDGFDSPSEEMAASIRKGLDIPTKGNRLIGVILLALGAGMLISSLVWILWYMRPKLPSSGVAGAYKN